MRVAERRASLGELLDGGLLGVEKRERACR